MWRTYRVRIQDVDESTIETFVVDLHQPTLRKFMSAIFDHEPDLKYRDIKVYYKDDAGDRIRISNAWDFQVFNEYGFNRAYVVCKDTRYSSMRWTDQDDDITFNETMSSNLKFAIGEIALYDDGESLEEVEVVRKRMRSDGEWWCYLYFRGEAYHKWVREDHLRKLNSANVAVQQNILIQNNLHIHGRDSTTRSLYGRPSLSTHRGLGMWGPRERYN